jgi:hypothetical protein
MKDIFERAERGSRVEVASLVERVPELMREARRRRATPVDPFAWALPRLAAVTAAAVLLAAAIAVYSRSSTPTFESVILGGDSTTGDVLLDALLDSERSDG